MIYLAPQNFLANHLVRKLNQWTVSGFIECHNFEGESSLERTTNEWGMIKEVELITKLMWFSSLRFPHPLGLSYSNQKKIKFSEHVKGDQSVLQGLSFRKKKILHARNLQLAFWFCLSFATYLSHRFADYVNATLASLHPIHCTRQRKVEVEFDMTTIPAFLVVLLVLWIVLRPRRPKPKINWEYFCGIQGCELV